MHDDNHWALGCEMEGYYIALRIIEIVPSHIIESKLKQLFDIV